MKKELEKARKSEPKPKALPKAPAKKAVKADQEAGVQKKKKAHSDTEYGKVPRQN